MLFSDRFNMMAVLKRGIIYSIIAFAVVPVVYYIHDYTTAVSPFGSVLSTYFYTIFAKKHAHTVVNPENITRNVKDPALLAFYNKLNWNIKISNLDYESLDDSTWQQYNPDGTTKANFLHYWQTVRPYIKNFYAKNIEHSDIPYPVVHFRCSDAPFVRHAQYHLSSAATVQWMADQIKDRGYDNIIMLNCTKHLRVNNNTCAEFIDFYSDIFKNAGLKITTQCTSIYNDFATMVNAPLLVSLNASSYAFMAGIAKDPQNYISCNLGREKKDGYLLQTEGDWIFDHRPPLLHKDVPDYHDAESVIKKL